MEKFAIDLDKVLDDFEFNEDCAEQIASINPSTVVSSTVTASLDRSSSKAYDYLVVESEKINREIESVSAFDKHRIPQGATTESKYIQKEDKAALDNPNYSKEESTDSINHYYTHESTSENKVTQKQLVTSHDSEEISTTIYNDISQKLLQKQQNGSSSPKAQNRYTDKLIQANAKPSVSNVFNSLNEYINAPPGDLDYVNAILKNPDTEPSTHPDTYNKDDNRSTENVVITKHNVIKNTLKDPNVNVINNDNSACTSKDTTLSEHQEVAVPPNLRSFNTVRQDIKQEEKPANDPVLVTAVCEKEFSKDPTITAINVNDITYEYENICPDAAALETEECNRLDNEHKPKNEEPRDKCECDHDHANIDINTEEKEDNLPSNHKEPSYDMQVQSEDNSEEDASQAKVVEIQKDDSQIVTEKTNNSKSVGSLNFTPKPLGFSNADDLSEEELRKYLAELEEEQNLNEENNTCQNVISSDAHQVFSENTTEISLKNHQNDEDLCIETSTESAMIEPSSSNLPVEPHIEKMKFPSMNTKKETQNRQRSIKPYDSQDIDIPKVAVDLQKEQDKLVMEKCNTNEESDTVITESESASVHSNDSQHLQNCITIDTRSNVANIQHDERHHTHETKTEEVDNIVEDLEVYASKEAVIASEQNGQSAELEECSSDAPNNSELGPDQNEKVASDDNQTFMSSDGLDAPSTTTEDLAVSGISDTNDERNKPVRPQTLDIAPPEANEDQTPGSAGATPGGQEQSDITGLKEEYHGTSSDVSDNSFPETYSVLGKLPPFWIPDSDAPSCMLCDMKFTMLKRRHHCRACGKVLCNKCCNMKYRLEYQGNIDSRVCVPCYQLLIKAESEHTMADWSSSYTGGSDINSPQLAGGLPPPPPTVMVPVGVLKREGGTKHRPEGSKSVMFSDGIRPGCDLTELDTSWDLKPPYRKSNGKRISTSSSSMTNTTTKKQNLPPLDPSTDSYIPQDPNALPPTVTMHKGQISYHPVTDEGLLYKTLRNECEPPMMFAINRNLYAYVKITNLNCCVNKICWNVTSRGLACVGQDEVILLVETLPDETHIPKDLLMFINQLYVEAIKGNTMTELGFSIYQNGNLLGSREHAGFLFIRQTLQCLQKIILPPAPFLVGLLVHRWETPWAKIFPLRLLLRLGAEYRYYPCPLVSVRFRDALYYEIGHTVMKVLADFRNFGYTLPGVRGLTIHLRNRTTDVMLPKNRYDQVIKGLNNSNDHVLAYASNFSITADSHLVCIQTNTGDESSYQTQAINIQNKPRTVTGASFIVINGALKSSMGLSAKSSIVEDGLMVEIMPEKMEALKAALKNMHDFSIGCGRQGALEPDETVNIKWVDNDVQFNLGVKSPIDGQLMDGIPSIRVHNGTDYRGTSRFIRWTEVFIIKSDDHPNGVHDPVDINKLSGNIAKATGAALVKLLDLLATAGLTKLGVRTTIHPDNVGYEAGSEGTKLPPIYMNSLDNELIQVLHKAAQSSQDTHIVLELIFYILDD
ncbi:hypothetical protein KM043_011839 [Ampulex compressa]|nr:hypothetical protein KM043_011839 [Ampulex compressa]